MQIRGLAYPALFFAVALLTGCEALHTYRPLVVQIRDVDTDRPVRDATVRISYPLTHPTQAPPEVAGRTGDDGIVRLRAAPYGPAGLLVEVVADGYLSERQTVAVAAVEKVPRAGWFEAVERRPANFTFALYAGPDPTVELVVPTGFRGLIHAEVEARADVPLPPRQRCFTYAVPSSGVVKLVGPPLLERVLAQDYRGRLADGNTLPADAKGLEIGFWCVTSTERTHTFLVGTRSEFEVCRRAELQGSGRPTERPSGGGKGGRGKGGRGRSSKGSGSSSPDADAP